MTASFELRPAQPGDEEFLFRLTARLADFDIPSWRTKREIDLADHAILREAFEKRPEDTLVLIAASGDTRLGYVFVTTRTDYFTQRPHGHIEILAVTPEAEGKGVARALMAAAEAWAAGRGYDQMTLNVFDPNRRARTLYERIGYQPEMVHYRKPLGPETSK